MLPSLFYPRFQRFCLSWSKSVCPSDAANQIQTLILYPLFNSHAAFGRRWFNIQRPERSQVYASLLDTCSSCVTKHTQAAVLYIQIKCTRMANAHLPYYSTLKSSGIFSSKCFELECSSSVVEKSIPARNIWKKIIIPELFSVLYLGKWPLTFSPNTSMFLCPATVGSC